MLITEQQSAEYTTGSSITQYPTEHLDQDTIALFEKVVETRDIMQLHKLLHSLKQYNSNNDKIEVQGIDLPGDDGNNNILQKILITHTDNERDLELIKLILAKKINLYKTNTDGNTVLHLAALFYPKALQPIIATIQPSDSSLYTIQNLQGKTAAHYLVYKKVLQLGLIQHSTARPLVSSGAAKRYDNNGQNALFYAITNEDVHSVELICASCTDIVRHKISTTRESLPLHFAMTKYEMTLSSSATQVVAIILEHSQEMLAKSSSLSAHVLHRICKNEYPPDVLDQALHIIDVNIKNNHGLTCLNTALLSHKFGTALHIINHIGHSYPGFLKDKERRGTLKVAIGIALKQTPEPDSNSPLSEAILVLSELLTLKGVKHDSSSATSVWDAAFAYYNKQHLRQQKQNRVNKGVLTAATTTMVTITLLTITLYAVFISQKKEIQSTKSIFVMEACVAVMTVASAALVILLYRAFNQHDPEAGKTLQGASAVSITPHYILPQT